MAEQSFLNIGLYTIPEAARLIRVSARKLRRWAEGYTFSLDGSRRFSEPVLKKQLSELAAEHILTFLDLIELKVVSLFREHGVSLPYIRSVAETVSKRFHTSHPFATRRFHTDGKRLFLEWENDLLEEITKAQFVFVEFAVPFFKDLEYEGDWVLRYWPLGREKSVVIDPERSFGRPIDSQSGVPTLPLYRMSLTGESVESIAKWFEMSADAVRTAIEYEQSLDAPRRSRLAA